MNFSNNQLENQIKKLKQENLKLKKQLIYEYLVKSFPGTYIRHNMYEYYAIKWSNEILDLLNNE